MKKVIIFVIIIFMSFSAAFAAELYRWTDKDGNSMLTDTPPPAGAQQHSGTTYEKEAPAEIRAAERERRERRSELKNQKGHERVQYRATERDIRQAKDDLARAEETLKRYQYSYRNARSQYYTDQWKGMVSDQSREVEQKRQRLMDLEN